VTNPASKHDIYKSLHYYSPYGLVRDELLCFSTTPCNYATAVSKHHPWMIVSFLFVRWSFLRTSAVQCAPGYFCCHSLLVLSHLPLSRHLTLTAFYMRCGCALRIQEEHFRLRGRWTLTPLSRRFLSVSCKITHETLAK